MNDLQNQNINRLTRLLTDLFEIVAVYQQNDQTILSLNFRFDRQKSIKLAEDRLSLSGYRFNIDEKEGSLLLTVDTVRKIKIPRKNIILFFLTVGMVYLFPVFYFNNFSFESAWQSLSQGAGIEFTIALMSILLIHEMGHFIASRRRDIITSWPYFIPAPSFIGTFGAVIKSKSPFWNRRDLLEVGAAGPIAGWIIALIWLLYGLTQSTFFDPQDSHNSRTAYGSVILDGESYTDDPVDNGHPRTFT